MAKPAPRPSPARPLPRFPRLAVVAWLVVALVVAWLLSMTLWPGRATDHINLVPFREKWPAIVCLAAGCSWYRAARSIVAIDLLGNLAVFVPYGAALAVATLPGEQRTPAGRHGRRWWLRIFAAGFCLSLGIELAQLAVPGRVTDIDDLILNVTGTLLGAAGIRFLDLALLILTR
jgi:glycopeptide antibiotics resistance protein